MISVYGNLWDYHDRGEWICITTNGAIRRDGCAVMGRGVALGAATRYPELPKILGALLAEYGNHVMRLSRHRMFTFPVKKHWGGRAQLYLIERSCKELMSLLGDTKKKVVLPRPGCGNGGLDWYEVRDAIYELLDDRVLVIAQPFNQGIS